jgi:hypothetical protein
MPVALDQFAGAVRGLRAALLRVEAESRGAGVRPLAGREWFELLERKLIPQLTDDAYLVVAVVGGTNIGKSVVFNHIAGEKASASSPLASGTKHPVCIVPRGFAERHDLAAVFPGFELIPWERAEAALDETDAHRLYWRESDATPENLLVLDTPDVDSDARINWERADHIRQCADLLIAVLTQQKYNDAAVKEFFRNAAAEDKGVVVLFNQCLLPEDEEFWPRWLETFVRETGVRPEWVYVAPNDRRAAEGLALPFYERGFSRDSQRSAGGDALPLNPADRVARPDKGVASVEDAPSSGNVERAGNVRHALPDGQGVPPGGGVSPGASTEGPDLEVRPTDADARNIMADLSRLRFADVKLRALRGAMERVVRGDGAPGYLAEVAAASREFRSAAELLLPHQAERVAAWPPVPNGVLIGEVRNWWRSQREGWPAKVHGFYNAVGQGISWPVKAARDVIQGRPASPWEAYRRQEWSAILSTVERIYERLTFMSEMGNSVLRERLERLLSGTSRSALLTQLETAHRAVNLDGELEEVVRRQLSSFREESPRHFNLVRRIDMAAAAARPVTSAVFLFIGAGFLPDFAATGAMHVASDALGGTIAAAVGETVVSEGAATGSGYVEAKLRQLHAAFTVRRGAWLWGLLNQELLGTLGEEIQQAAGLPQSTAYREAEGVIRELRGMLARSERAT